jgi:hypothetical protein
MAGFVARQMVDKAKELLLNDNISGKSAIQLLRALAPKPIGCARASLNATVSKIANCRTKTGFKWLTRVLT